MTKIWRQRMPGMGAGQRANGPDLAGTLDWSHGIVAFITERRPLPKGRTRSTHRRVAPPLTNGFPVPALRIDELVAALPDGVVMVDAQGRIVYANALMEVLSGYSRAELSGQLVELLVPERLRDLHTHHRVEYVANPHARPMGVNLEISLRRKDGKEFPADIALSPLQSPAGLLVVAAVRDATERRRAQNRMHAVIEVTQAIMEGESERALRLIAHHARVLGGAGQSMVAVPEPGGETLVVRVADGERAEALIGMRMPVRKSLAGEAFRTGNPINVPDVQSDARAHQATATAGRFGPTFSMPLRVAGRSFGTLVVANQRGQAPFAGESLKVVELFATQAAVALEYARLREELQRLAVLEDRERIAKELHDGVIQALFAVGMTLQATEGQVDDPETVRTRLAGAVESIDSAIRDLRNYIFGLRPGLLADRQLDQALRQLAEDFQEKSDIITVVDIDARIAAQFGNASAQLVQIAREALSNVARHGQASTCRLSLVQRGEQGVLVIDDDGRGFELADDRQGQGLRNMRERAEAIGGTFSVESSPTKGTTVRIALPL